MVQPTQRLFRRICEVFDQPDVHHVTDALSDLGGSSGPAAAERIQTAVVMLSGGDIDRLEGLLEQAGRDWRDVLVAAELADHDWPRRLDDYLGRDGS